MNQASYLVNKPLLFLGGLGLFGGGAGLAGHVVVCLSHGVGDHPAAQVDVVLPLLAVIPVIQSPE